MTEDAIRHDLRARLDALTPRALQEHLEFERRQTGFILAELDEGEIGPAQARAELDSNAIDIAVAKAALRRRAIPSATRA